MKLKSLALASLLVLTCVTSALAKDIKIFACTADKKVSSLVVDIDDHMTKEVEGKIRSAFITAAKGLSATDLQGQPGYNAFMTILLDSLTDDEVLMFNLYGPPQVLKGLTCADIQEIKD